MLKEKSIRIQLIKIAYHKPVTGNVFTIQIKQVMYHEKKTENSITFPAI